MKNRIEAIQKEIKKRQFNLLQKILLTALFCFLVVTSAMYCSFLLGYRGFILEPLYIESRLISDIISIVLFFINLFFMLGTVLELYDIRIVYTLGLYVPIYFISETFITNSLINSILIPFIYVVVCGIALKRIMKTVINYIAFSAIIIAYQYLSITVKIGIFKIGVNILSPVQLLLFSIDLIIVYATLYFLIGGEVFERKIKENCARMDGKPVFCTEIVCNFGYDQEDEKALKEFQELDGWDLVRSVTIIMALQVFQLMCILMLSKIGNVMIECIIILFGYFSVGVIIKRKWHAPNFYLCTIVSSAIFYTASKISPPAIVSVFALVIVGILISCALFFLAIHFEEHEKYKIFHSNHTTFNLKTCTERELIEQCKIAGIPQDETALCVRLFVTERKEIKKIASEYGIEEASMRKKKSRYAAQINNVE